MNREQWIKDKKRKLMWEKQEQMGKDRFFSNLDYYDEQCQDEAEALYNLERQKQ